MNEATSGTPKLTLTSYTTPRHTTEFSASKLLYTTMFDKTPSGVLINGEHASLPLKPRMEKLLMVQDPYDDWQRMVDEYSGYIGSYGGCEMGIPCFGIVDDAVNSFSSYFQNGAQLGSLIGAILATYLGGDATVILVGAGLGAAAGAAFVVSLTSGLIIGTWMYDSWSGWYYTPNR